MKINPQFPWNVLRLDVFRVDIDGYRTLPGKLVSRQTLSRYEAFAMTTYLNGCLSRLGVLDLVEYQAVPIPQYVDTLDALYEKLVP